LRHDVIFLSTESQISDKTWLLKGECKMRKFLVSFLSLFFLTTAVASAGVSTFEDLTLDAESYWNGSDGSGGFSSSGANFNNNYSADWGSWDGFSYSNITDTTTDGLDGQYNAIASGGAGDSNNYAVGYYSSFAANPPTVTLPAAQVVNGAYFTNNNYAYYSMLNGDQFAKKFEEGDWFKLTVTGKDASGGETGKIDFYLANGRDILNTWTWVDLRGLGSVKSLELTLTSSDTGAWGMNTPAYFAMDSLAYGLTEDNNGCFIGTTVSSSMFQNWSIYLVIFILVVVAGCYPAVRLLKAKG
jgi:hypothetical protein